MKPASSHSRSFVGPQQRSNLEASPAQAISDLSPSERVKIPTTFIPLSPDRINFEEGLADILFGLFHIMWEDMPRRRVYSLRFSELIGQDGNDEGCRLICGGSKRIAL